MKRKFLLSFMLMSISIFAFGLLTVSAYSGTKYDDYLYYQVEENGEVTITDCTGSATEIVIPSEIGEKPVTGIGTSAFYGCTRLTAITIPDSVASIDYRAFYNCTALTQINWNAKNVADFSYNDDIFYNAGTGGDGIAVVFGDNVERIPAYLFYPDYWNSDYYPNITSVTIGDGVTTIGSYAFYYCTGLTSLTIGDSVTTIGDYAFYECTGLTSVTIGDSVTTIGDYAFYECTGLTSVTIGDSVTTIGECAFYECTALTQINWNAKNVADFSDDDHVFSNAGTGGDGIAVLFGDNVEHIPAYLFYPGYWSSDYHPNITSVTIGTGVTSIGKYAFSKCTALTQINWNAKNVADFSYNDDIFYNAGTGGDGIAVVFGDNVEHIPAYLFDNSNITSVTIGDSVTTIGDDAFYNCTGLTSITIPDSVTTIGDYAFYDCTGLTSVAIGDSVTTIGSYAFYNCTALTQINWNAKNVADFTSSSNVFYNAGTAADGIAVVFGDNVEHIPAYLFYPDYWNSDYYPNITSVTIGDGVTTIGSYAFYNCTGLTSITIPEGVTTIGDYAFRGCTGLTSITIPEGVTAIGSGAFYNCTALTQINWNAKNVADFSDDDHVFSNAGTGGDGIAVVFGDSVEHIPAYLFYSGSSSYRANITSVTIGDSVTTIGSYAFYYCTGLTSITIPDGVTTLGDSVFSYCDGLTAITIGTGLTGIGKNAFDDCDNLASVNITDIAAWCNIDFAGICDDSSYYYRSYSANPLYYAKKLYLNGELITDLVIPDTVTAIKPGVFAHCTALTSVKTGSGVTGIGERAFYNCENITSVTIGDKVISVGNYAFYECERLASLTIPSSLSYVGQYAFSNRSMKYLYISDTDSYLKCEYADGYVPYEAEYIYLNNKRLVNVVVPDGLSKIPSRAFHNCNSVTNITIPDSVTELGEYAFSNCNSIKNVYITSLSNWCGFQFGRNNALLENGAKLYINGRLAENIVIPSDVTKISDYAFYRYESLKSVVIPDGVTAVGNYAFERCNNLTSISIPGSVTAIGEYAFDDCRGLLSVSLNDGVTELGDYAFNSCYNLKYLVLPKSVTEINSTVFSYCESIALVFYTGDETEWSEMYIGSGNDTVINAEKVYNAKKKTYKFNTNCDITIDDITDYAVFDIPKAPNGNKRIVGWFGNADLSGSTIQFPYYGDVTTLYAAWTDRTGTSFDDAFAITENTEQSTIITKSEQSNNYDQTVYYEFVPKFSGEYRFYTIGNYVSVYGTLYDSSQKYITSAQVGNEFKLTYNLTAGETYYIEIDCWVYNNVNTGTLTLGVETDCYEGTKTVCVASINGENIFITIPGSLSEDATVMLACYKNNALTEVMSAPNKNEPLYFIAKTNFDRAKVMVWESLTSMKPLCSAEIVDLS